MSDRTRPSAATRDADETAARQSAAADREPTPEEEQVADEQRAENGLDESVRDSEAEMLERGAHQKGEGRIP